MLKKRLEWSKYEPTELWYASYADAIDYEIVNFVAQNNGLSVFCFTNGNEAKEIGKFPFDQLEEAKQFCEEHLQTMLEKAFGSMH